ncbi:hypothetical protein SAMN05421811_12273 [Nonomuraea wenchangensis]|uniref:Alcohol dehydrogenase-like N-terminal domain-containing protein n=1 Tax=Nonomuraea wenchangensis TaxID=568860 RepID=A0A1I0LR33_9ACTN|nr:hypothetical protein SAMN05421811_12273 [Nonomuraea wenchangensis]
MPSMPERSSHSDLREESKNPHNDGLRAHSLFHEGFPHERRHDGAGARDHSRARGRPEVLTLAEVERPEPMPTEVLVRVHAVGVHPTGWKSRTVDRLLGDPPAILGWDVSGVVEAVGLEVTASAW